MSSTDLATAVEPLLPIDPGQASQMMRLYQETTRAWLDDSDWIGPPGDDDSFVKKSGWDKIATAYRISTSITFENIDRDAGGNAVRARVHVRGTGPDGRYREGDGGCADNEPRFVTAAGRQKVENDIPGTATTRASNRAIRALVGFGKVSAEEVDADVRAGASAQPAPAIWALSADDVQQVGAAKALREILEAAGADVQTGLPQIGQAIRADCEGTVPLCVVHVIEHIQAALGSAPADDASEVRAGEPDAPGGGGADA